MDDHELEVKKKKLEERLAQFPETAAQTDAKIGVRFQVFESDPLLFFLIDKPYVILYRGYTFYSKSNDSLL